MEKSQFPAFKKVNPNLPLEDLLHFTLTYMFILFKAEYPLPEQYKTKWDGKAFVTVPADN